MTQSRTGKLSTLMEDALVEALADDVDHALRCPTGTRKALVGRELAEHRPLKCVQRLRTHGFCLTEAAVDLARQIQVARAGARGCRDRADPDGCRGSVGEGRDVRTHLPRGAPDRAQCGAGP